MWVYDGEGGFNIGGEFKRMLPDRLFEDPTRIWMTPEKWRDLRLKPKKRLQRRHNSYQSKITKLILNISSKSTSISFRMFRHDPLLADADAHLAPNHEDQTAEHPSFLHVARVS